MITLTIEWPKLLQLRGSMAMCREIGGEAGDVAAHSRFLLTASEEKLTDRSNCWNRGFSKKVRKCRC